MEKKNTFLIFQFHYKNLQRIAIVSHYSTMGLNLEIVLELFTNPFFVTLTNVSLFRFRPGVASLQSLLLLVCQSFVVFVSVFWRQVQIYRTVVCNARQDHSSVNLDFCLPIEVFVEGAPVQSTMIG